MWYSLLQAIKGLPKRQVADDIESDEVQPLALLICETISLLPGVEIIKELTMFTTPLFGLLICSCNLVIKRSI